MTRVAFVTPEHRQSVLDHQRNQKMAASANAYVRGSTARFYAWLEASDRPAVPDGPPLWICGDCHVGNLGPVGSTAGVIGIEIRDFDQTVIGNPAHDLIRMGLSLAMAARGSDLPGVTTARMTERMIIGYEAAFAQEARGAGGDPVSDVPKLVHALMRVAAGRSWRHLARERIDGVEPKIPLGRRFWPLTLAEREAVRRLATSLRSRADDAPIRVLDAAYWRKGCSSLGKLRLAVLVAVGAGRAERHCLMDVKEAGPTVAPRAAGARLPADDAMRVVTGARMLSPFLGERMLAAEMLGKSVFLRELLPQDLKLEVEHLAPDEAVEMAQYLAHIVGRAHARQLSDAGARKWLQALQRGRSKSLDAPSWLWNSVVDLVGVHEAAYLQHCRRYALDAA